MTRALLVAAVLAIGLSSVGLAPTASAGVLARPGGAVVFTFDDGCASALDAASALEARGYRGTFFVTTLGGLCPSSITRDGIASLAARGHDVESHSVSHPDLTTLGDAALRRELADSKSTLQGWTGKSVSHIAYPYGASNDRVAAETARSYSSGRLYYQQFSQMPRDTSNPYEVPSIGVLRTTTLAQAKSFVDAAAAGNVEIVLTFHDITNSPREFDTTPALLGSLLDYTKSRGIPVITYAQALGGSSSPPPPPPPPSGAPDVRFLDRGGSEWWVQVGLAGAHAPAVVRVDSRDTGGAWTALAKRSWGDYAGSYHVEPGHLVTFRATLNDGRVVTSCEYTHPGAACAGAAPPPSGGGSFQATFRNVRGNEWWIEADASASGGTLAGVDARPAGGAWTALDPTSWGSWARSVHAAGGSVELRARATDGSLSAPAQFTWPPS